MLAPMKYRILALVVVALALTAIARWVSSPEADESVAASTAPALATVSAVPVGTPQPMAVNDKGQVEIDMVGAKLDAARLFDLGFAGGLQIDKETRDSLGTLLTTMSDPPTAREIEQLESTLRRGLPQADAERAVKLFHDYRGYLGEMKADAPQLGIPETAEAASTYFDKLEQIQRRHFDDRTATALFGQDNHSGRLILQATFINLNSGLSASDRKQHLDLLRAQLPADQRHLITDDEPVKP